MNAMLQECERVEKLGLCYLNVHPGSTAGKCTKEESIDLISKQLNGKTGLMPIDFRTMHKKFRRFIDRNECVVFI